MELTSLSLFTAIIGLIAAIIIGFTGILLIIYIRKWLNQNDNVKLQTELFSEKEKR